MELRRMQYVALMIGSANMVNFAVLFAANQELDDTKTQAGQDHSASAELRTEPEEAPAATSSIDLKFMYKGIGTFVTIEDQQSVMALLEAADTLGDDGPLLIFDDLDRRVPNGRVIDFDGLMWLDQSDNFAAIDVYASPGLVPDDWPGLVAPPFQFPTGATFVIGASERLEWFGNIMIGVRIDEHPPSGDRLIAGYVGIYRQIAGISRNPEWAARHFDPNQSGNTLKKVVSTSNDKRVVDLSWDSDDDLHHFRFIGSDPISLDTNPEVEWVFIRWWTAPNGVQEMHVLHLSQWAIEPEPDSLPACISDFFGFYDLFPEIRDHGVYLLKGGLELEHISYVE